MNRVYPPELKAQVIAEWSLGMPLATIAKKHDIPRSTVRVWTKGLIKPLVTTEKIHDIDALYTEFVTETLMALRSAAKLGQDEDWLRSIPPREAYLWFGTLSDKALAALSAYESASERLGNPSVDVHTTTAVGTRLD